MLIENTELNQRNELRWKSRDKRPIVTGGASGLGAATARALAAAGAKVAVFDLNEKGANDVAKDIGGIAVACDVSNAAGAKAAHRNRGNDRARPGPRSGQLRRHRSGQAHCRPRRADAAGRLRARHPHQPDRHLQHDASGRRRDAGGRAARRRRAWRHRLDRVGRRLRRPDRPVGLFGVEGRRRRADHAGGARIFPIRHSRHGDRARHFRHADADRAAAGNPGFARRFGAVPQAPRRARANTPRWCCIASTTAISMARSSASTAHCAWRRGNNLVMAGLVPAIHVLLSILPPKKTWMPGPRPGMTMERLTHNFSVAVPFEGQIK